jgi:beta-lactamase regulating signal transducer with metallopeptidase domain
MTLIEIAAWLGSSILLKGSVVAVGSVLGARVFATSAAGASLTLGLGFGVLGLVVLLGPLVPQLNSGVATISHEAVQSVSIGSLRVSLVGLFVGLWAIGAVLLLVRLFNDLRGARALVRTSDGGRGTLDELLKAAAKAVGCERIPEVRETSELATVALIGFRRPVLLIPVAARDWSDEELFGVLCHELEHMRRGDWLMLMLERIISAIFWPNPLVHLLGRLASGARERAADDAAMRAGAGASAYAGRLIAVARDLKRTPRLVVSVAFADGGRVDQRVRALFEPRDRRGVAPMSVLRACIIALPLVAILAVVEPWTCLPGGTTSSEACP